MPSKSKLEEGRKLRGLLSSMFKLLYSDIKLAFLQQIHIWMQHTQYPRFTHLVQADTTLDFYLKQEDACHPTVHSEMQLSSSPRVSLDAIQ